MKNILDHFLLTLVTDFKKQANPEQAMKTIGDRFGRFLKYEKGNFVVNADKETDRRGLKRNATDAVEEQVPLTKRRAVLPEGGKANLCIPQLAIRDDDVAHQGIEKGTEGEKMGGDGGEEEEEEDKEKPEDKDQEKPEKPAPADAD